MSLRTRALAACLLMVALPSCAIRGPVATPTGPSLFSTTPQPPDSKEVTPTTQLGPPPTPSNAPIILVPQGSPYAVSASDVGLTAYDLAGRDFGLLSTESNSFSKLSPDETLLAVTKPRLHILNIATGLTVKWIADFTAYSVSWAPDNKRLVAAGAATPDDLSSMFVIDIGTGSIRRLTMSGAHEGDPAWSPDGQWIAFEARPGSDHFGNFQLFVLDTMCLDRSSCDDSIQQLTESNTWAGQPSWAPDSKSLSYSCGGGAGYDICVIDLATGVRRRLVESPYPEGDPVWSPDGTWIGFTRQFPGPRYTAFIVSINTGAEVRLSSPKADAWFAFWLTGK